jgi:NADPH:quinone reductase-like Zn-dependent oxidoreductase
VTLQSSELAFRFRQRRQSGVGVLPEREERLVCLSGLVATAIGGKGTRQAEVGECIQRRIDHFAAMLSDAPELGGGVFDVVGATTFDRCRHSLKPSGVFLQNIMELTDVVRVLWTSLVSGQQIKGGVAINNARRMSVIADLAAAGTLWPVIDRSYPLEQIADAFKHVEKGHKRGNVVITVAQS